jgi:2,4-dienoyl-CoA reductase-like NADH-dependent reductase (Old Yellow Enzyme family)
MSSLFTQFKIKNVLLENRIVIPPMCQYSAEDGVANDWHLIHYGSMGCSGAGLMFIEATAVNPSGRISPGDLGLWSDECEKALANILSKIRTVSHLPIAIQIAHAGRKASCARPWDGGHQLSLSDNGWETIAPSAIPFNANDRAPKAATDKDLDDIKSDFINAAIRAVRLGIDIIELHVAHGYLLHEFLSPVSNQREDEYGGSLENRMRFPIEVFEAVRKSVPSDIPVGVRISASDWIETGWDINQSISFVSALESLGCDFVDVSSGGISPNQKISISPGYQVPFASAIKKNVHIPVIAVGLITEPLHAQSIIQENHADLVGIARGMLYDPRWPWHAAAQLGEQINAPKQYLRSQPPHLKSLFKNSSKT